MKLHRLERLFFMAGYVVNEPPFFPRSSASTGRTWLNPDGFRTRCVTLANIFCMRMLYMCLVAFAIAIGCIELHCILLLLNMLTRIRVYGMLANVECTSALNNL